MWGVGGGRVVCVWGGGWCVCEDEIYYNIYKLFKRPSKSFCGGFCGSFCGASVELLRRLLWRPLWRLLLLLLLLLVVVVGGGGGGKVSRECRALFVHA